MKAGRPGAPESPERPTGATSTAMEVRMCQHHPTCPAADAVDREAAHVVVSHPEQGWSLLCNGIVLFDDAGVLLPGRQAITTPSPAVVPVLAVAA